MSEFEDRVNSILGDPAQMEKIANLAKSFMGGENSSGEREQAAGGFGGLGELARSFLGGDGEESGLDMAAIGRIGRLLSAAGERDREKKALLEAMKPYRSQKRREKMDKAMKIARLARIAGIAMGEEGKDGEI